MIDEIKDFLNSYLILESKLNRLKEIKKKNPENNEHYKNEIKNLYKKRNKIERKIETVKNEILREILYNKYILGKTLEEISLEINYSKRHTERLHIKALKEIKL